jgi:hypothetical protein
MQPALPLALLNSSFASSGAENAWTRRGRQKAGYSYAPPRKQRAKPKPVHAKLGRPASPRKPKPTGHRALELLVDCGREGCTEAVLLANKSMTCLVGGGEIVLRR